MKRVGIFLALVLSGVLVAFASGTFDSLLESAAGPQSGTIAPQKAQGATTTTTAPTTATTTAGTTTATTTTQAPAGSASSAPPAASGAQTGTPGAATTATSNGGSQPAQSTTSKSAASKPAAGAAQGSAQPPAGAPAARDPTASKDEIVRCLAISQPSEIALSGVEKWGGVPADLMRLNERFDLDGASDPMLTSAYPPRPLRSPCAYLGAESVVARKHSRKENGDVWVEVIHVWRHNTGSRACVEHVVSYSVRPGYFGNGLVANQAYRTGVVLAERDGGNYKAGRPDRCLAQMGLR